MKKLITLFGFLLILFSNLYSEERVQIVNSVETERSLFQKEQTTPPFYKEAFLRIVYDLELSNGSTIHLTGIWYDLISRVPPVELKYSDLLLSKYNSTFIGIGDELIISKRKIDKNNIYTRLWQEWAVEHSYSFQLYRDGEYLEYFMGDYSN